ncbi:MAG: TetR/AcrR family transcriptional regulator [Kineosporiaceae bacterium]
MSSAVERRRERWEPDARRRQILGCAVRLFGERGYDDVSTADIAGAAGVARGLVNHYFGTKKDLYLEVVRLMVTLPDAAVAASGEPDLAVRVDGAVTWFLDAVARHSQAWLAAIGAGGPGHTPDVAAVIAEGDEATIDVILRLAGSPPDAPGGDEAATDLHRRAVLRAYVAFGRRGAVEWLVRGSLTREQTHVVLSRTLVTLLAETLPALAAMPPTRSGTGREVSPRPAP